MLQFSHDYIKNSNNEENLRGKTDKLLRVSVERLCAGPAVPLMYEFYKQRHPELPRVLETGDNAKNPD